MRRISTVRRSRFLRVSLVLCLCLFTFADYGFAGKNKRRGRRQSPASRARQQNMKAIRHTASHTGVHVKLGEAKQGIQKIGVDLSSIRAIHERNLQNSSGVSGSVVLSEALKERVALKELQDAENAEKREAGKDGVLILKGK